MTRSIAAFLRKLKMDSEAMVYVSAVGGHPFTNYIEGFLRRAVKVGLPALIVACMDLPALQRCQEAGALKFIEIPFRLGAA